MTIITSVQPACHITITGNLPGVDSRSWSYNFGAGNKGRVKKAFFTQFTVCIVFTSCFWLIMLLFPKLFAGIFSNNTDLITYTTWALRIYMAGIFSLGFRLPASRALWHWDRRRLVCCLPALES
ncbi:MAG: MATE family efflux transporter [Anaerobutyricum soehngenii]